MSKHFRPLQKVEKRKSETLPLEDMLDRIELDGKRYVHVPGIAFEKIYKCPEYNYLKKGLYVAEKRINYSKDIQLKGNDFLNATNFKEGELLNAISWYQAKLITERLGGQMMTIAEFMQTAEWLNLLDDEKTYENITTKGTEWLDGYTWKEYPSAYGGGFLSVTTHSHVTFKNEMINGHQKVVPPIINAWNTEGFFNIENVEPLTGFPRKVHTEGNYYYTAPKGKEEQAVLRGVSNSKNGVVPALFNDNQLHYTFVDCGVRLCYTKNQMERLQ